MRFRALWMETADLSGGQLEEMFPKPQKCSQYHTQSSLHSIIFEKDS